MNRIENLMTTRELAEVWNVSTDTIQKAAKKLFDPSAIQRKVVNGGNSMAFNELQATLLHDEITGHHNLHSRDIEKATSELEEDILIAKAQNILQRRIEKLTNRVNLLEEENRKQRKTIELDEEEIHIDSVQISRWIRKRRWPQTDNM